MAPKKKDDKKKGDTGPDPGELAATAFAKKNYAASSELFEVAPLPQDETKPQKARKGRKDKGKKRGMSAYNLFVKERIKDLKAQKLEKYEKEPKLVFKDAVAMWTAASKEEKEAYTQKLHAAPGGE